MAGFVSDVYLATLSARAALVVVVSQRRAAASIDLMFPDGGGGADDESCARGGWFQASPGMEAGGWKDYAWELVSWASSSGPRHQLERPIRKVAIYQLYITFPRPPKGLQLLNNY